MLTAHYNGLDYYEFPHSELPGKTWLIAFKPSNGAIAIAGVIQPDGSFEPTPSCFRMTDEVKDRFRNLIYRAKEN